MRSLSFSPPVPRRAARRCGRPARPDPPSPPAAPGWPAPPPRADQDRRGGNRPERAAGPVSDPSPHRRLPLVLVIFAESVLVPFPPSVGRQPCQIQRPKVTGGELGADADDSRKRILGALHPLPRIVLADQVGNHRLRCGRNAHMAVHAVLLGDLQAEQGAWQPEHDLVSAPVRQIQMRVVVPPHHHAWITPEVPPVILVGEAGSGDPGPGRQLADLRLLGSGQRTVNRQKLVILILAHPRPARPGSGMPATPAAAAGTRRQPAAVITQSTRRSGPVSAPMFAPCLLGWRATT